MKTSPFRSSFFQADRWKSRLLPWLVGLAVFLPAIPPALADPGRSVEAHTTTHHGRFYVSGLLTGVLPGHQHAGSHVEVEVLDGQGRVLATAWNPIGRPTAHPRGSRWGRERFVVSFPETLGRQAALVRVRFHNHSHSTCQNEC